MFAKAVDGIWMPGIGDPTFAGWLTVAAYFGAALLAFKASRSSPHSQQTWFWILGGAFLLFLGVNKQLDLQTGMTWLFKQWAVEQGWYGQRRSYQQLFIVFIALAGAGLLALLLWFVRRNLRDHWLALAGALFLICFVLIRASSFHYVDQMLGFRVGGLKLNWILELGGIGAVICGARRVLTKPHDAGGGARRAATSSAPSSRATLG